MGYAQKVYGRTAQIWPLRKRKTENELEELREENKAATSNRSSSVGAHPE